MDNQTATLHTAQGAAPGIHLGQADALALPFPPRSFDLALCALAFHHLGFEASARLPTVMANPTTRGFVVGDLRRALPPLLRAQPTVCALLSPPFSRPFRPSPLPGPDDGRAQQHCD